MIIVVLAGHLLCWEHHPGTPRAGLLSVLPSNSVGGNIGLVIKLGLRRPTESLVANPGWTCVSERDRETDTDRDRQTERDRETETERKGRYLQ